MPAKAALQKEAAKPDAPAVANGKEELLRGEELIHVVSAAAWADHRAHRLRVDRDRVQMRHIKQHSAAAHVVARPAVSTRTHPYRPAVGVCQTDGCDYVFFTRRLDDDVGIAIRQARVAAAGAARSLVTGIAPPERFANEISSLLHANTSRSRYCAA